MGNNKRKQRQNNRSNKKHKLAKSTPKPNLKTPIPHSKPQVTELPSDLDFEPYTKPQLINFLIDATISDPSLLSLITSAANTDISHRKIFVHGLSWDTTRETLLSTFTKFGNIQDCNVVVDKTTGKSKGFGFVVFETRDGASESLKESQKMIGGRLAAVQLASVGPDNKVVFQNGDIMARKIYVSNVGEGVGKEKLRVFFEKFGEIETGPLGFDVTTGKSRGFALFLYKNVNGAKNALKEPCKMFDGHQLHCQKATASNKQAQGVTQEKKVHVQNVGAVNDGGGAMPVTFPGAGLGGLLPYGAYSGMLMNPNAGYFGGVMNPWMAGVYNPSMIPSSSMGIGSGKEELGGYGGMGGLGSGLLGGGPLVNGAGLPGYGLGGSSSSALQGLSYLGAGSSSDGRSYMGGNGYPSYM